MHEGVHFLHKRRELMRSAWGMQVLHLLHVFSSSCMQGAWGGLPQLATYRRLALLPSDKWNSPVHIL